MTEEVDISRTTACYSPLTFDFKNKVAQFRIATLASGEWSEPIRCRLTVHSLHDPPQYKTISYAWGNPQDTGRVVLDGVSLTVPVSLELCLRYLRSTDTEVDLWTDAICIDQTNDHERALQVMQMGYIYWNCSSMYIWLGEPASNSDTGNPFEMILHWAEDKHFYDYPGFSRSEKTGDWIFEDNLAYQKMYEVFSDFISRSWWTRLWCVQEIALCPEATIVLGRWRIPWATVLKAKDNHGRHDLSCCAGIANHMPAKYTYFSDHILFLSQRFDQTDMDQTVRSLRHKLCKDPRDKIYGLLGLLWKNPKAKFHAIYSLPPGTLYTQYTEEVIRQANGDLRFLTGSGLGSDSFNMSSWVRNFAAPLSAAEASHEHSRYKFYNSYNASARTRSDTKVLENGVLSLSGTFVDRINCKGAALQHRDWTHMLEVVNSWAKIAGIATLDRKSKPGSPQDCFWRAILADLMPVASSGVSQWERIAPPAAMLISDWFLNAQDCLLEGREPLVSAPLHALWVAAHGRCIFSTEKGHLGLCYPHTTPGDEIWVLAGGKVPFVLRTPEDAGVAVEKHEADIPKFTIVGECYLDGFMDGEVFENDYALGPVHLT